MASVRELMKQEKARRLQKKQPAVAESNAKKAEAYGKNAPHLNDGAAANGGTRTEVLRCTLKDDLSDAAGHEELSVQSYKPETAYSETMNNSLYENYIEQPNGLNEDKTTHGIVDEPTSDYAEDKPHFDHVDLVDVKLADSNYKMFPTKVNDSFNDHDTASLSEGEEDIYAVNYEIIEPDTDMLKPVSAVAPENTQSPDERMPSDSPSNSVQDVPSTVEEISRAPTLLEEESNEWEEMLHYTPLDTVYHSEILDVSKTSKGHAQEQTELKEATKTNSSLPVGFFDDADADADARGVAGPTKRRKKDIDSEYRKFESLMEVELHKRDVKQNVMDNQRHEHDWEDETLKQKVYAEQVGKLREKWEQKSKWKGSTAKTEQANSESKLNAEKGYESDTEVDEEFNWRSKTIC